MTFPMERCHACVSSTPHLSHLRPPDSTIPAARGCSAREFRMSFRIDLDVTYEVATIGASAPDLVMEESDDE